MIEVSVGRFETKRVNGSVENVESTRRGGGEVCRSLTVFVSSNDFRWRSGTFTSARVRAHSYAVSCVRLQVIDRHAALCGVVDVDGFDDCVTFLSIALSRVHHFVAENLAVALPDRWCFPRDEERTLARVTCLDVLRRSTGSCGRKRRRRQCGKRQNRIYTDRPTNQKCLGLPPNSKYKTSKN